MVFISFLWTLLIILCYGTKSAYIKIRHLINETAIKILCTLLKVHKIEIFFGFDFELCFISLLDM
jgi:hypothetical protein